MQWRFRDFVGVEFGKFRHLTSQEREVKAGTKHAIAVVLWLCAAGFPGVCRGGLDLELFAGVPVNVPSTLRIEQDGFERLEFEAEFDSRPFEPSPFYAIRLNLFGNGRAWALDFTHHKLFLKDPPSEVETFSITHGFNLVTVQRRWAVGDAFVSAGAGVALAHAESTVRDQKFDEESGILDTGYRLTGPVVNGALGTRVRVPAGVFLTLEARVVGARVRVPVAGGNAAFEHLSFHFMAGVGFGL